MLRFAHELEIPQTEPMQDRLLAIADGMVDQDRYERRMQELAASPDVESADEFKLRETERVFQGYTKPSSARTRRTSAASGRCAR